MLSSSLLSCSSVERCEINERKERLLVPAFEQRLAFMARSARVLPGLQAGVTRKGAAPWITQARLREIQGGEHPEKPPTS